MKAIALLLTIAVTGLCLSASPLAAESDKEFTARVRKELNRLEARHSDFKKDLKYEDVQDCKSTVSSLIEGATTETRQRSLAVEFCAVMSRADHFRRFEYYLLWLGGRAGVFEKAPSKTFVLKLVAKVESRKKVKNEEIRGNFCLLTFEQLEKLVDRSQKIHLGNYKVDWAAWRKYADWVKANHMRLVFDPKVRKFRLPAEK